MGTVAAAPSSTAPVPMRFPAALLVLAIAGCAATRTTSNSGLTTGVAAGAKVAGDAFSSADSIRAGSAMVWTAIAPAFQEMGIEGRAIDANRSFGVRRGRVPRTINGKPASRYLDCGLDVTGMARADFWTVTLDFTSELVPIDSTRTLLRSRVTATATRPGSSSAVRCGTTGLLEEELAGRVRALVAGS